MDQNYGTGISGSRNSNRVEVHDLFMKKGLFIILICISPGSGILGQQGTNSYISTGEARENYADGFGDILFFIFPETRENPIKWYDSVNIKWLEKEFPVALFEIHAQPGEYMVYQVGVWALEKTIENLEVRFSDLAGKNGLNIGSKQMTCFNKGGIDMRGIPFSKMVRVDRGRVQALWMGIDLANTKEGSYIGTVSVLADGIEQSIPVQLEVHGKRVRNHGFGEGSRLSRMAWLNSEVGLDSKITRGYEPVMREGNSRKFWDAPLILHQTVFRLWSPVISSPQTSSLWPRETRLLITHSGL